MRKPGGLSDDLLADHGMKQAVFVQGKHCASTFSRLQTILKRLKCIMSKFYCHQWLVPPVETKLCRPLKP
ncbi:hypothetical protein AQUCO_03700223v1 [Aquilegia coerulea]|uniref:Uncharacterized protein n=1 Tax=Aquilegia coerulea TaxID=218851 RepID=A0A2G5CV64_AQUCA|nr:hypothetical protein AQUCO_03700223v1 [Aquilegia coerulea]